MALRGLYDNQLNLKLLRSGRFCSAVLLLAPAGAGEIERGEAGRAASSLRKFAAFCIDSALGNGGRNRGVAACSGLAASACVVIGVVTITS